MSRKPSTQPASDMPEDEPYKVGYGKPPKHTRFKPGQSGNPKGRPKATKSMACALTEALKAPVKLRQNGSERSVAGLDALALRIVSDAVQGRASAQRLLVDLIARFLPMGPEQLPAEDGTDYVAELMQKLDVMRERMKQEPSEGE